MTLCRRAKPLLHPLPPWNGLMLLVVVVASFMSTGSAQAAAASPFYEFGLVARPGAAVDTGGIIASIEPAVSVNEKTECAFIAQLADGSEQLIVFRQPSRLLNLSRSPAGRNFDFPQLSNHGRVVTRELLAGNSLIRLWDAANTGASQIIASSTLSEFSQVSLPTIGNTRAPGLQPLVGFLGRMGWNDGDLLPFSYYANDTGERNVQDQVSPLSGTRLTRFRSQSADTDQRRIAVLFSTPESADRLMVYEDSENLGLWSGELVATTQNSTHWLALGASPGLSGSGKLLTFFGEGAGTDRPAGIYLAFSENGFQSPPTLTRLLTINDTIAFTDAGQPITFSGFDADAPVSVAHVEAGAPGLEDDWAIVTFIGTPAQSAWPSDNPHRLKLFSDQPGLWSLRVDFERHFQSANPPALPRVLAAHPTPPIRVVQQGDTLRLGPGQTFTVLSFAIHDPLTVANHDRDGSPRVPGRGDHHLAFSVSNGTETVVVRGSHLDTDEDGLLDHWEEPTKGIDADGDGVIDLSLASLGAHPYRKDAFLEIDWLNPRTSGSVIPWSNAPAPGVAAHAARVFAEAPVRNPDGSTGITLHVDAGPDLDVTGLPYSANMPDVPESLGGGELVGMPSAPGDRPDIVYFNVPGAVILPGAKMRSFTDVKRQYFENRDRGARELAFRYLLMADFFKPIMSAEPGYVWNPRVSAASATQLAVASALGAPNSLAGNIVVITHGRGAGQIRRVASNTSSLMTLTEPLDVVPDSSSRFALVTTNGGRAEVYFREFPDYHGHPGNDIIITLGEWGVSDGGWLGSGDIQWRTIVHELGHTLGLRHGGVDHNPYKGDAYLSLMSYSWQLKTDSAIQTFSYRDDPTFNDWDYVKHDFSNYAFLLGNAFGLAPDGNSLFDDYEEPTLEDFIAINGGPPDLRAPTVSILQPTPTAVIGSGPLAVSVRATDDAAVKSVVVRFDLDGDGRWDADRGEVQTAAPAGAGTFTASFAAVAGPRGTRRVLAVASDRSDNHAAAEVTVLAGSGAGAGSIIRETTGTFAAQAAGAPRQSTTVGPITLPSSGRLAFTVTADPPVRQTGQPPGTRFDATVDTIRFAGRTHTLRPACTAAGLNPSVCTSTWLAPSGGTLDVTVLGPAILDAAGHTLAHPAQNYRLTVVFQPIDITPPTVSLVRPGPGAFAEIGRPLSVEVSATDDFAVASVTVAADLNGDEDETDPGESVTASAAGAGLYRAQFAAPSGRPGVRRIRVNALDSAGHSQSFHGHFELREPDVTPPQVTLTSPPPGWPVKAGDTVTVALTAFDAIELATLEVRFDRDGDGTVAGPGEIVAATKSGANQFTAIFTGVSGPNGPRTMTATAKDASGNSTEAQTVVTIGGITPVTETIFSEASHAIPSQSSSGSQLVIPYPALTLPGAGTVKFTVTATPPVRQAVQNIPRVDPYVRDVTFNGAPARLTPACNAFGSNPAICATSYTVNGPGTLGFSVLGPGVWNTFGEFVGHGAQSYSLKVDFTAVDVLLPAVSLVSPVRGADVALGTPLAIVVEATDAQGLASVIILIDINGDGDTDDFGERQAASHVAANRYQAQFPALSGVPGTRAINVLATDPSFNTRRVRYAIGTGGVGAGESVLLTHTGVIAAQPIDIQGGRRQTVTVPGLAVPGAGRLTFRIDGAPPVRQAVANIERHDATVTTIRFNGQSVALTPECNPPGSNPATCVSQWDSTGSGTLDIDILGPAQYNIWGEFIGHPEIAYTLEVTFVPGPNVTTVTPSTGSVGGGRPVTVRGSGFAVNAMVLFDGIPAGAVTRTHAGELTCLTPPGTAGPCDVRVLNPDPDGLRWNYGVPFGLFGTRAAAFTYQAAPAAAALDAERLLGTWAGNFAAVGAEQPPRQSTFPITLPGPGRLRFSTHAFIPILNPIAGPFDDPGNLDWHNESAAVRRIVGGNGITYVPDVRTADLSFPYAAVIAESVRPVDAAAAGSASFTVFGPARWNAFWRQFDDFVMTSAPAQDWVTAAWFAHHPTLSSIQPATGTGGSLLTVRGSHFTHGMRVTIGGTEASQLTVVSPTELTCRVPFTDAGHLDVTIDLLGMTATLPTAFRHDGKGGPNDDADADGLPTLVEQFMGLNPAVADAGGAIHAGRQGGALVLYYRRARDTGGATGLAEYSNDLITWLSAGVAEIVVRDDPSEPFLQIAAIIPGTSAGRFARLRVRQ